MKKRTAYDSVIGLMLGLAFFGYCGFVVVTKVVAAPRVGHYFGAFIVPTMFLILLIRELAGIRGGEATKAKQ